MDKEGLLLLSRPDRVTIGLLFWDGPGKGLRLLLQNTDRFSSHVSGTLGTWPRLGKPSEAASACEQEVPSPREGVFPSLPLSFSFSDPPFVSQASFTRTCSGGPWTRQMTASEH